MGYGAKETPYARRPVARSPHAPERPTKDSINLYRSFYDLQCGKNWALECHTRPTMTSAVANAFLVWTILSRWRNNQHQRGLSLL